MDTTVRRVALAWKPSSAVRTRGVVDILGGYLTTTRPAWVEVGHAVEIRHHAFPRDGLPYVLRHYA